jgi:hypothetical protein
LVEVNLLSSRCNLPLIPTVPRACARVRLATSPKKQWDTHASATEEIKRSGIKTLYQRLRNAYAEPKNNKAQRSALG